MGSRDYFGENPQPGAHIYYSLTKKAGKLSLTVQDFTGKTLASMPVKNEPGLHRVTWNLRGSQPSLVGIDALLPSSVLGALGRTVAVPPGQGADPGTSRGE
jgi:hypothetical protein